MTTVEQFLARLGSGRNLHSAGHAHSGLVLCTADAESAALAARIDAALAAAGDPKGQLIRVNRPPA